MFISFEGIDGSGKSTQAYLLAEALRAKGREVLLVREPGGTPLGEALRTLLLERSGDVTPRAEALLFSAARAQLVERVVRPALQRGCTVIADRFYDSSSVYQGQGRHLGDLSVLHAFSTNGLHPDRTYIVDVSVSLAAARRSHRPSDRMEAHATAFHQLLRDAYRQLAADEPKRVRLIDGSLPMDITHRMILQDLESQG